jgi:hypothetical protein
VGIAQTQKVDRAYFDEVKEGTRELVEDKEQNLRILVERQKDGLYHWLIETLDGGSMCEGVHDPKTNFTAEMCIDKTSKAAIKALENGVKHLKEKAKLEDRVQDVKEKAKREPAESKTLKRELIHIAKDDWLSKIALKMWGDKHAWKRYLRPTQETRQDPRRRSGEFNPDLIYPGDTFEVIGDPPGSR